MSREKKLEQIRIQLSGINELLNDKASLIDVDVAMQQIRSIYLDLNEIRSGNEVITTTVVEQKIDEPEKEDNLPDVEVDILTGDEAPEGEVVIEEVEKEAEVEEETMEFEALAEEKEEETVQAEQEIVEKEEEPQIEEVTEAKEEIDTPMEYVSPENNENQLQEEEVKNAIEETEKEKEEETENGKTVADQYQNSGQSLNDKAAIDNKVKDLASKLKDQPIADLKAAINLNDRFLFTRDLFSGNAEKYSSTIEDLNNAKDLDEAMEYMNSNFEWDMEKDSFKKFLELIYRRHIPTEN